jgi:hypothetical protein|tara:strand:+ start:2110 stop:3405 length:1296 start_codon:yes stop_codon:yes gene_type:complete
MKNNSSCQKAPKDPSELMPILKVKDGWIDDVPSVIKEPVQAIAADAGEACEIVLAAVITIGGHFMRHTQFIAGQDMILIPGEINSLVIRPEGCVRLPWYDAVMQLFRDDSDAEHAFCIEKEEGRRFDLGGRELMARESILSSDLRYSTITKTLNATKVDNILLHGGATSLLDELDRLTSLEKKDLRRVLQQAWHRERVGDFDVGVGLLWDVDAAELDGVRRALFGGHAPLPVLLLQARGEVKLPSVDSMGELGTLQAMMWAYSMRSTGVYKLPDSVRENTDELIVSYERNLSLFENHAARGVLSMLPNLFYRIALIFRFTDKTADHEALLFAAWAVAKKLIVENYGNLWKITDGFTASASAVPDNPVETLKEYELLAKISVGEPIKRTKLNRNYSNGQRKMLDTRLSRLLQNGRAVVDASGRYSVGALMSD